MKLFKSSALILAFLILTLSACKKNSSENPSTAPGISLKFNGTLKSSKTIVASIYTNENSMQVIGTINGTEALSLMIQNIKVGTFNVATDAVVASYSTSPDFANTYLGSEGSVTITSLTDNNVSGTFQFTGTNSSNAVAAITEGTFTAKLIKVQQQ
jgi:hypothetical protein